MIRVAAAAYLMIVTAVGPAACCCTFSRLAERPASKPTAPHSCCCHGSEKPAAEAPERPTPPDRRDSPGCPCKQAVGGVIVALPAAHDEANVASLRAAL